MELKFKITHGTMNEDPTGTFLNGDKMLIRKDAHRVTIPMGDDNIEMWKYSEWKGTQQEYIQYSNDLLTLPSNQLQIIKITENVRHENVEVEKNIVSNTWIISMYRNETLDGDMYSYEKLVFERPIEEEYATENDIKTEYDMYRESMFQFAIYPESPIKANRDSLIPLMNAIIEQQKTINTLTSRIETLEGGN